MRWKRGGLDGPLEGCWTDQRNNIKVTCVYDWSPGTDIAAAFEMEAEIERRGLRSKYARELVIETQGGDTIHCVWTLIHATPLQRCLAALRAVDALEKK